MRARKLDNRTTAPAEQPLHTWRTWSEALRVVAQPEHLRRTLLTALIVGTILFAINQLNVVLDGDATSTVWLKAGLTYLVPFAVSNIGILIATHRHGCLRPGPQAGAQGVHAQAAAQANVRRRRRSRGRSRRSRGER